MSKKLGTINGQELRLKYIEKIVCMQGFVTKEDIKQKFNVSSASVTHDFSCYNKLNPNNLIYNPSTKRYEISQTFKPFFKHKIFSAKSPVYYFPKLYPFNEEKSQEKIRLISNSIQSTRALEIIYYSKSKGKNTREIVPVSFIDTGLLHYLRAYDRLKKSYINFAVHRIIKVKRTNKDKVEEYESPGNDIKWLKSITLKLRPHPKNWIGDKKSIEDETLEVIVRQAMADLFLNAWHIDCSQDKSIEGIDFQYYLSNLQHLRQTENLDLNLAPGFKCE